MNTNLVTIEDLNIAEINGGYSIEYGASGVMGIAAGIGSLAAVAAVANPIGAAALGTFALASWTAGVTSSTMAFSK